MRFNFYDSSDQSQKIDYNIFFLKLKKNMGVDYFPCHGCDEIICDCGDFKRCEFCNNSYCSLQCGEMIKLPGFDNPVCRSCWPCCNYCKDESDDLTHCLGCHREYDDYCFGEFFDLGTTPQKTSTFSPKNVHFITCYVPKCTWCDYEKEGTDGTNGTNSTNLTHCERCESEKGTIGKIKGVAVSCECGYKFLCKPCMNDHDCLNRQKENKIEKFVEENTEMVKTHILEQLDWKEIGNFCSDMENFPKY